MQKFLILAEASKKELRLSTSKKAAMQGQDSFTLILNTPIENPAIRPWKLEVDPSDKFTGATLTYRENVVWDIKLKRYIKREASLRTRELKNKQIQYKESNFDCSKLSKKWFEKWKSSLCIYKEKCDDSQRMQNSKIFKVKYQQGTLRDYKLREHLLEKLGIKYTYTYYAKKVISSQNKNTYPNSQGESKKVSIFSLSDEFLEKFKKYVEYVKRSNATRNESTKNLFNLLPTITLKETQTKCSRFRLNFKDQSGINTVRFSEVNNLKFSINKFTKYSRLNFFQSFDTGFTAMALVKTGRITTRNNQILQLNLQEKDEYTYCSLWYSYAAMKVTRSSIFFRNINENTFRYIRSYEMKNIDIASTQFGELLEKYDIDYYELISGMIPFMMERSKSGKEYVILPSDEGTEILKKKIDQYASKSIKPSLPDLLRIMKIVGCGMEELLLTLKIEDHTKALLPSLDMDKYLLPIEDAKLKRQGHNFKILEVWSNYHLNLNENFLRVTKKFKIKFYIQNIKIISDLIYNDAPNAHVNSSCMDNRWSVVPNIRTNYLNIKFDDSFCKKEVGEITEIKVDLFYSDLNIEDTGFYTNHINYPTDLLKISGSFTGLKDELKQIRLRQYSHSNTYKNNKGLVGQKDVTLDKDLRFQAIEISKPPLNSIFELDWSGLTKTVRQLV